MRRRRATHLVIDGGADDGNSSMLWLLECGHTASMVLEEGLNLIALGRLVACEMCADESAPGQHFRGSWQCSGVEAKE